MTEMSGPNRLAAALTVQIAHVEDQRRVASTRQERRDLNRQLHRNRALLHWCRTRAGYCAELGATSANADDAKEHEA